MATARGLLMLRPTMATEATVAMAMERGPLTLTMAATDTAVMEATAMARGPPMLRPLPLPSQRLMLTMATEATDMERGPQMPTMAATDMAAMAMARGLLTLML